MQDKKLTEKEKNFCQQAQVDPKKLEAAINKQDVKELNSIISSLQKFLTEIKKKLESDKSNQYKETIKLAANLIAELQKIVEAIQQREQTKSKLSNDNSKPKSVIEQLFDKLKVLEKEGAVVSWLFQPQGEKQADQIITNQDTINSTKNTIQVKFNNGTELHVHPTGVSVPDQKHINKDSIPQIAKTVAETGMKNVMLNKEAFPEKDRDALVKQLSDALQGLGVNVANAPEKTQEKEQKQKVENEQGGINTLKQ